MATLLAACQSGPTPAPQATPPPTAAASTTGVPSATPGASLAPGETEAPTGPPSSQALIGADLDAGAITLAQSLEYRAWALFWDPRLPERYDGAGSVGEDQGLFRDIGDALPNLPADQQAILEPFLLRPTDPLSAFSAAPAAATSSVTLASLQSAPPDRCTGTWQWYSKDWSPDGNVDHGFRAWACGTTEARTTPDLDTALAIGAALWGPMTRPVPAGMGLPIPDTGSRKADGNGKIDIYLLDSFATCRIRGSDCEPIPGDAGAAAAVDQPYECGRNGAPPKGCSAYMLLNRSYVGLDSFVATFAHEFFHVLQSAHNGKLERNWYEEASAVWAEWQFVANGPTSAVLTDGVKRSATNDVFNQYRGYQEHRQSLLKFLPNLAWDRAYQYEAWGWPLFQAVERGPASIFNTWALLEGADLREEVDEAVDAQTPFADLFRDFAVRNAQPLFHVDVSTDDMPDDRWRNKPLLGEFPEDQHRPDTRFTRLTRGTTSHPVRIQALNAHYEPLEVSDPAIRSIKIDISALQGHEHADIDVIGLVSGGANGLDTWRRFRGSGPVLTLCRDTARENVRYIEIVISNHSKQRKVNDPDPAADVKGSYTIETADKCIAPDHFSGTIAGHNDVDSWTGTVTFDRVLPGDPMYACNSTTEQVTYCYQVVAGQVTWTAAGHTTTLSLAPPHGTGTIQLIVSDERHPDRAGAYAIIMVPALGEYLDLGVRGHRSAQFSVYAWSQVINFPHWPADYHLSGTEDHSGCGIEGCGTQIWSWDLVATFDP